MPEQPQEVQLSEEDVEYLIALLRSSSSAMTTEQLVEALRSRPQ
jgi:hypothetical protein